MKDNLKGKFGMLMQCEVFRGSFPTSEDYSLFDLPNASAMSQVSHGDRL